MPTISDEDAEAKLTMRHAAGGQPSRPSVRLTALLEPVMTMVAMQDEAPARFSGMLRVFEEREVEACCGSMVAAVVEGEIGEDDAQADLEQQLFQAGESLPAAAAAARR